MTLPALQLTLDGRPHEVGPVLVLPQEGVDPLERAGGEPGDHILRPEARATPLAPNQLLFSLALFHGLHRLLHSITRLLWRNPKPFARQSEVPQQPMSIILHMLCMSVKHLNGHSDANRGMAARLDCQQPLSDVAGDTDLLRPIRRSDDVHEIFHFSYDLLLTPKYSYEITGSQSRETGMKVRTGDGCSKWLKARGFAPVPACGRKIAGVWHQWSHEDGSKALVGYELYSRTGQSSRGAGAQWGYTVEVIPERAAA